MAKAKRLTGLNPLAYLGVEPDTPLQFTVQVRNPTTKDYSEWNLGALWLNENTDGVWMLVDKQNLVATWIQFIGGAGLLQTLTGDSGGAVGPDGANNINVISAFSPLSFDGNPATNTITLNSDGTLAVTYQTDTGSATAAGNTLNVSGGTGIDTSGAGDTITIATAGEVARQYDTEAGSAVPVGGILNVVGGSGIDTAGAGNTVTVSISGEVAAQYDTDSGSAIPAAGVLNILGGFFTNTSGAGNTVTVNMTNLGGPGVVVTDSSGNYSSINGTDGQLLIAATGGDPLWANVTSSDVSVTITNGPNTLDLKVASVGGTVNAGENINIDGTNRVNLNRVIRWPATNAAGTEGVLYLGATCAAGSCTGGDRFMHNYGPATAAQGNTFLGTNAGNFTLVTVLAQNSVGIGAQALEGIDQGGSNVGVGNSAAHTVLNFNTAVGSQALSASAPLTSISNTCIGMESCLLMTHNGNTAVGYRALNNLTTGTYNLAIGTEGFGANNYTSSESSNLIIGNAGVVGESNTIRIGTSGGGTGQQNACYIAGIYGVTTSGGVAVYINSDDKLGTSTSSIRYKENVEDMGEQSSPIMDLRPVSFTYKADETHEKQYGLIAEEVEEVLPEIVIHDKEGNVDGVQYQHLIPMLLNEAKKLRDRIKALEEK